MADVAALAVVAFTGAATALHFPPSLAIPNRSVFAAEKCAVLSSAFLPFSRILSRSLFLSHSVSLWPFVPPAINHGHFVCCFLLPVILHLFSLSLSISLFSIFICTVTQCCCGWRFSSSVHFSGLIGCGAHFHFHTHTACLHMPPLTSTNCDLL